MTPSWRNCCWQLGLAGSLVIVGVMEGASVLTPSASQRLQDSFVSPALAQSKIVPDDTLGAKSSIVTPLDPKFPVDQIEGGAIRGANLFHSFQEFNVSAGRGAYFFSPNVQIHNILARVTGSNPSEILGTIGTFGNSNPNLFLINPNGIIFGPKASLDMGNAGLSIGATVISPPASSVG